MEAIIIQSPVKGTWSFMNPPGHHPDAKDFVAVDSKGLPYRPAHLALHLFYLLKVTHTYAWGKEVFSPFNGTVVETISNIEDRYSLNLIRDLFKGLVLARRNRNQEINYFLGNHIIIESSEGVFALLAHLKKDSILVKKGQHVPCGELIAQVGNSGNTIQPHLHFQLMANNDPGTSNPIPFLLTSYELKKQKKQRETPYNFEVFDV